jgi:uncharacterized protein (TIGR02145 family)
MAEVKNSFLSAKMNKDLDDRLIPNGEYRDALNIQIGKSESSDIGTVQPIWGNAIPDGYPIEEDETMKCIGAFMDEKNNRIYQFLTNYFDPSPIIMDPMPDGYTNKITMFDLTTLEYRVLVSGTFLNLATNPEFSITGVNLLENLLFWTDNRNQPRKINVEFAIGNPLYYTNEVQISVAKYAPLETIEMYRKLNKTASAPNVGNVVSLEDATGVTKGMQLVSNNINGGDFAIVVDVIGNDVTLYNTVDGPFTSGAIDTGDKVTFLASTMSDRSEVPTWPGDPDFLQDKYVRFSYRYKFDDGEYSLMAPFTQIAYIPNQKGYFIDGDENEAYRSTVVKWVENNINNIELLIPFPDQINLVSSSYKITELDILYKESDSLAVKVVETVKIQPLSNLTTNIYTFQYQSQKPYKTLPEDQTVRVYDRVPVRARAQETVSNRVVYGNYRDKYFFENTINYNTAARPKSDVFTNFIEYPNHTLKQNRTYQVGFILADKFGRQSSVILSEADLSTVTSGNTIFGGSTVYAPFIDNEDILFPGTKKWFGNALSMVVNSPLNSNKSTSLGQSGLYANQVSPSGFAINYSNISGNVYKFKLDSTTWPTNIIIPSEDQYLRGKYKDYVKIILPVEGPDPGPGPSTGEYTITTDGPINDLYNYNPEFSAIVPDIKYSYTINEIGWYSYKVVVRQQEQNYYNVYLPGILNGYPELQTYGSQLTYSNSDGIELATVANVAGTWIGTSFESGYSHTAGSTAPLTTNISAIPGSYYNVQYTIAGATATDNLKISFGDAELDNLYVSGSSYIRAITSNTLEIVPDSNFNGSIKLSLKLANASLATNQNGINTTNFPVGETNRTAHVVLINDNINKIPRDLSEVGPDQKQYRSSVNLFGRVQNKSVEKGDIIGEQPEYDSVTTTIKYKSASQTSDAWQTIKPGDSIQCVEANTDIPGTPPLSNPNKWYANTVVVSNVYDPDTGDGVITFAPSNTILLGPTPSESYITFPVYSSTNEQYFPTTKADIATSIANALDFSFLDNSLENISGTAGVNFYQLQTNPIMSRISTKSGIGVEAGNVMLPFLAVYETKAEESLLDIFWESSTTGYISDLNWDVLTGFDGPVAVTTLNPIFYEDQYDGGEDGTGDTKSPYITDVFTTLNNQDIPVSATSATMAVVYFPDGITTDAARFFELESNATNPALNPGEYRIKIKTDVAGNPINPFVFNNGDPENEVYTFTITFSYTIPGSTNDYTFSIIQNIQLGNARPIIGDDDATLVYNITTSDIDIDTLTGVNGAYSTSANQEELYWEIDNSYGDFNKFSINSVTGELKVASGVTLEDYDSYEIIVSLTDATIQGPVYEGIPVAGSRGYTSLYSVVKVGINVLPPPVNSEIKPYITENNFLYNQSNTGGVCAAITTPTGLTNPLSTTNVKYGVVYVGKEPLLNNTSDGVLLNTTARSQLPATPVLGSFEFGTNTTQQYQRFVNIETAVNIQNLPTPSSPLPATVGFKEGTLRWTIVLGGTTSDTNGTIQEASLLAYLWRRPAATNNQPNTNTWSRIADDNNVFDTGTINSNFPDRYKSGITTNPTNFGFINNYPQSSAAANPGKYGENFLAIKLDCTKNEKGFRMTSFTTTAPQDGVDYEWALTLVLIDTSTGCTAPLNSVGANAMVYVHDANFYYDGVWGGTISPTQPPKFIFTSTTPITNVGYEYKTGMQDTVINNSYVRATPYLDSIPFHLQDNRTRLKFSSVMYKITVVTAGPSSSQIITFGATGAPYNEQLNNSIQAPNVQRVYDRNDNMSPGMTVWKVPAGLNSAAVEVGRVEIVTNNTTFRFNPFTPGDTLAVNDIIIIKQSQDNTGILYARTKFGNSIRQLYINEDCTQKWQPPIKDKFYVVQTQTDQNMQGAGVGDSLLLGKVSNNPLYCMNLNEKGKVYVDANQGAEVKFNVQTCWDAGLFADLESTYVNIAYKDGANPKVYRSILTTKNYNGTEYRDKTPIPKVTDSATWNTLTTGAYCDYNNNEADSDVYGKLYNWYTTRDPNNINNASNRLAPYGWAIPPREQFDILQRAIYFGYGQIGAIELKGNYWKEIGTSHWITNTIPASNDSLGFTAIGNGYRREIDNPTTPQGFAKRNIEGNYWTSSNAGSNPLNFKVGDQLNGLYASVVGNGLRIAGYSVRFVKENMNTPGVYGRPLIQYLGVWSYDTVYNNG